MIISWWWLGSHWVRWGAALSFHSLDGRYNVEQSAPPNSRIHNPFSVGEEVHSSFDHSEFPAVNHLVVLRAPEDVHEKNQTGLPAGAEGSFAALMLELMARSQRVAVVEDAPAVMVELHRGGQAVVLVEYPRTLVISELITAVSRYYPRVSLWQATHDSRGHGAMLARIVSTASVSAASQPHQMLDDLHSESAHARHQDAGPSAAIVSDEELAMLMSPFETEDPRTGVHGL